jgi:hypothetical protein
MPNPDKKSAYISALVAILAVVLIFVPGWIGMDGMRGGYALSFIAFFAAVSAGVVALFFRGRAARLERVLRGEDVLAHWTYSSAEWQQYAVAELKTQGEINRVLWWVMFAFCVGIGALFWLFDHEAGGFVFLVLLGVALLLALFAFGMPRLKYRRQQRTPGEAWITHSAVYFDGALAYWNYWGSRLDGVTWQEPDGSAPACLCFEITYWSRTGQQSQVLRVPVPFEREAEARTVLASFDKD